MAQVHVTPHVFEPALFSMQDLSFLLGHLEETPAVALHKGAPVGVCPVRIVDLLTELQELDQVHKAHGDAWSGFEAVRDSILRFLAWQERSLEIYRRTGGAQGQASIRHPSQYAWDSGGSAFKFGIDADSAEMVRTEILDDGSRRPFAVRLLEPEGQQPSDISEVAPWIKMRAGGKRPVFNDELVIAKGKTNGTIKCSVCERTETFESASRQAYGAARARMKRHLTSAKTEVARHRLLCRKVFESPTARA